MHEREAAGRAGRRPARPAAQRDSRSAIRRTTRTITTEGDQTMTTPPDKKDRRTQSKRGDREAAGRARPDQKPGGAAAEPDTGAAPDADASPTGAASTGAGEAAAGLRSVPEAAMPEVLARVISERDLYLDHLQRLKAEFENYRKRVQRDNEALVLRAGEGVLESLLPVLDNMARTLQAAEQHEEGQLIKGVEIVSGQLRSVLESHGLDEVPAGPGVPFDPAVHEAVVAQDSDEYSEGLIIAVLAPGYLLHGRLLRPARVIVAR